MITVNNIAAIQSATPADIMCEKDWDPAFRFSEAATIQLADMEAGAPNPRDVSSVLHQSALHVEHLEKNDIPEMRQEIEDLKFANNSKKTKIEELTDELAVSKAKHMQVEGELRRRIEKLQAGLNREEEEIEQV